MSIVPTTIMKDPNMQPEAIFRILLRNEPLRLEHTPHNSTVHWADFKLPNNTMQVTIFATDTDAQDYLSRLVAAINAVPFKETEA